MKKIIRWLSDISGVSDNIRKETEQRIGNQCMDAHYWFGDKDHRIPVGNVLWIIGYDLTRGYYLRANTLRDEIDNLKFKRIKDDLNRKN